MTSTVDAVKLIASDAERAAMVREPEKFIARAEHVLSGMLQKMRKLEAERALLADLGGTCHSPIAVLCQLDEGALTMRAALFSPDGTERIEGEARFEAHDHAPVRALAADLLARASPAIAAHFGGVT